MARLKINIEGQPQSYPIGDDGIRIGRSRNNTVVLNHPHVSRNHANVELKGREVIVRDLDSSNGTFVNGMRVKEAPLHDDDVVTIGPFEIRFD